MLGSRCAWLSWAGCCFFECQIQQPECFDMHYSQMSGLYRSLYSLPVWFISFYPFQLCSIIIWTHKGHCVLNEKCTFQSPRLWFSSLKTGLLNLILILIKRINLIKLHVASSALLKSCCQSALNKIWLIEMFKTWVTCCIDKILLCMSWENLQARLGVKIKIIIPSTMRAQPPWGYRNTTINTYTKVLRL